MKTLLVIFGITGDLANRKLLPALNTIVAEGDGEELSILGVSRREVDSDALFGDYPHLTDRGDVFSMDLASLDEYDRLKKYLEASDADSVLFYLSVPPGAAAGIVDLLGEAGINSPRYRVLFEKPFGYDLHSAQEFIDRTSQYFDETQIYRIDHYMAKDIAAQLLKLRQGGDSHHHWGGKTVGAVRIVATETLGVEGRGQFYEQTGALRDFIQGHLMQLLSLVLLDGSEFSAEQLIAARLSALEQLQPADPSLSVRAQYVGYDEEVENPGSRTETSASVELYSDDPAWKHVPLHLMTGKAFDAKRSAIEISYTDGTSDVLEEGVTVGGQRAQDAYERVLLEAIAGGRTIFTTSAEILRSWELLAPLQEAWAMEQVPLKSYPVGASLDGIL